MPRTQGPLSRGLWPLASDPHLRALVLLLSLPSVLGHVGTVDLLQSSYTGPCIYDASGEIPQ
jgi:hypothetical protein